MKLEDLTTLIEMLAYRADVSGNKPAFTFKGESLTFKELWRGINNFAAYLLELGLEQGECAIVSIPNGVEFFFAFYGIQRAGGIAVPVFPEAGAERIFSMATISNARIIVAPSKISDEIMSLYREAGSARGLSIITCADSSIAVKQPQFPMIKPEDIAFLQYTSGSTGNPKGVMLTHGNLLTNIRQMIAGMEISARDIFASWLPVYHDMGLILKTMVPFYLAAEVHLLPTDLRDVRPWLEAIQQFRATFTAAPDFAYRLVMRHIDPDAYNLSSLRVALNAAEPVRATTINEFERLFRLENVMVAGYGLAEATVGVSMWKPQTPAYKDSRGHISVGKPFPGVDLLIQLDNEILPAGDIGEIMIRSKANSLGYYNNPTETACLFWKDGYIHSGDLGYVDHEGNLFIVSRKKNLIKRSGETISPQEIEEVMDATPEVRFSAAIGVDKGGIEGEQVFVFAEVRNNQSLTENELHEIALNLVERFYAHMGFRMARIYLLKPRSIPLTHNGKIQHGILKDLYLSGSLREMGKILYPEY